MAVNHEDDRIRFARRAIKGCLVGIAGWALLIGLGWYVGLALGISWRGAALACALVVLVGAIRRLEGRLTLDAKRKPVERGERCGDS